MKELFKRSWPDFLVVLSFLLLSFLYFATPLSQGLVLGGHDTVAGMGQGQEQSTFYEATGERTRWTNSIFSGMPTYQIAPTYDSAETLGLIGKAVGLFTTGPLSYLFLYLFGFYLLMRAFRFRPLLSAFGAMAWAFSSYFFIIIAAGHLWKVTTLGFIPPTIAGLVLAYRGKYLWGALVTGLFTALQVLNNHIQMTYYFLFVMAFIVAAYAVEAVRKHEWKHWAKATGAVVIGGVMGALINLPNLYHTWEYSKESMRGAGELAEKVTPMAGQKATGGLERDYITAWSYGIDETLTLMIANFKGGGSQSIFELDNASDLDGYDEFYDHAGRLQEATGGGYLPGMSQYWGNQPMTVGPVYVGAILCFLFMLGLFIVRGPMKWALAASTVLSLLFAWGKNLMPVTDFFIDYLPMYAKFRTVSSALVIAEFTIPVLAVLGLAEILREPERLISDKAMRIKFGMSFALTAGVCLLFALAPGMADVMSAQDAQIFDQLAQGGIPADFLNTYRASVLSMHQDMLSADAWRSFALILVATLALLAYAKWPKSIPAWSVVTLLFVVTLGDMWTVNRRYLNDESFSDPQTRLEGFAKTPADETILADKDPNFRVLNLGLGNPFNETSNQTAYHHKSIGGYHAAKLHRYQDLIDYYLADECAAVMQAINKANTDIMADSLRFAAMGIDSEKALLAAVMQRVPTDSITPTLNMLNAKWFMLSQGRMAVRNPAANGNAWFVQSLKMVEGADAEIDALKNIDNKHAAVADKRFAATLEGSPLGEGTVKLNSYAPNELRYTTDSKKGGLVVFSEIYYPGWTATLDGKPVEIGRANYILRALKVPAGRHEIVMEFRPTTVSTTNAIAYAMLAILLLGFGFALWRSRKPQTAA